MAPRHEKTAAPSRVARLGADAHDRSPTRSAYYGVSIGEFDYSDRAAGLGGVFNDSVDSWRVMIGYQFSEHFAFEGNYGKTSTLRDTVVGVAAGVDRTRVRDGAQ